MDELKYRIWNGYVYLDNSYPVYYLLDMNGKLFKIEEGLSGSMFVKEYEDYENKTIIERCSGFKDIENELIYVNDVLINTNVNPKGSPRYVVIYEDGEFYCQSYNMNELKLPLKAVHRIFKVVRTVHDKEEK